MFPRPTRLEPRSDGSRAMCPDSAGSRAHEWLLPTFQTLGIQGFLVTGTLAPPPPQAKTPFHGQGTAAYQRKCTRKS